MSIFRHDVDTTVISRGLPSAPARPRRKGIAASVFTTSKTSPQARVICIFTLQSPSKPTRVRASKPRPRHRLSQRATIQTTQITMRITAITVFAIAALTARASAASLDVEPIATAAPPSIITSNSTSDRNVGVQGGRWCKGMLNVNWDDYKYACVWYHTRNNSWTEYWNQFFMKWNGDVVQQCDCDNHLSQYNPWGSRWTFSYDSPVSCYTRDGKHASEVKHAFDLYSCTS